MNNYSVIEILENGNKEIWRGDFASIELAQAKAEECYCLHNVDASNEELDELKASNSWNDWARGSRILIRCNESGEFI